MRSFKGAHSIKTRFCECHRADFSSARSLKLTRLRCFNHQQAQCNEVFVGKLQKKALYPIFFCFSRNYTSINQLSSE